MAAIQETPGSLRCVSNQVSVRAEARYRATGGGFQENQVLRGSSRISGKGFRVPRAPTIRAWPQRGGNFLLLFPGRTTRPHFWHHAEGIPFGYGRRRANTAGAGRSGSESAPDFQNLSKAVRSSRR